MNFLKGEQLIVERGGFLGHESWHRSTTKQHLGCNHLCPVFYILDAFTHGHSSSSPTPIQVSSLTCSPSADSLWIFLSSSMAESVRLAISLWKMSALTNTIRATQQEKRRHHQSHACPCCTSAVEEGEEKTRERSSFSTIAFIVLRRTLFRGQGCWRCSK